jgi:hypothetical protein
MAQADDSDRSAPRASGGGAHLDLAAGGAHPGPATGGAHGRATARALLGRAVGGAHRQAVLSSSKKRETGSAMLLSAHNLMKTVDQDLFTGVQNWRYARLGPVS